MERTVLYADHNSLSNNVESLVIPTRPVARLVNMDIEYLCSTHGCGNLSRRPW